MSTGGKDERRSSLRQGVERMVHVGDRNVKEKACVDPILRLATGLHQPRVIPEKTDAFGTCCTLASVAAERQKRNSLSVYRSTLARRQKSPCAVRGPIPAELYGLDGRVISQGTRCLNIVAQGSC